MPRPPSDDPRTHKIQARLTSPEMTKVDAERGATSLSDWIRHKLLRGGGE